MQQTTTPQPAAIDPTSPLGLWLAALRSGDFEQARHRLRNDDRFCCLGVACEVYRRTTGNGGWESASVFRVSPIDADISFLPDGVREWLGVNNFDAQHYADMNDTGRPFAEIADAIERRATVSR